MRSDDRELHLMMSGERAARRQERDSSTPAAALWLKGNPHLRHVVHTSSHSLSCTFSLPHLLTIHLQKRNNRPGTIAQRRHILEAPPPLRFLFISALTDTVRNRDVWILLWLNHVADGTGPLWRLWSPLEDWHSEWWGRVSPAAYASPPPPCEEDKWDWWKAGWENRYGYAEMVW